MRNLGLSAEIKASVPPAHLKFLQQIMSDRRVNTGNAQPISIITNAIAIADNQGLLNNFSNFSLVATGGSTNLTTINGGLDGDLIFLKIASNSNAVVFKNSGGNIICEGGADLTVSSTSDLMACFYDATLSKWKCSFLIGYPAPPAQIFQFGAIGGLIISSIAGTHTTAAFNISKGGATDSTGAAYISVAGTIAWAAANGNAINGTDAATSTLANSTTYHVFICTGASGTGSFVSASMTPTFPTGYAVSSRRIGSFNTTAAGAPIPYTSIECDGGGVINWLGTQVQDVNATAIVSTARTLETLGSVPTGIKIQPFIRGDSNNSPLLLFTSPDETDVAVGAFSTTPGADSTGSASAQYNSGLILTTNTSAQIGIRGSGNITVYIYTRGWKDFRRS